jgi:hypothetical protein
MKQIEVALRTIQSAMIMSSNNLVETFEADPSLEGKDVIVGGLLGYRTAVEDLIYLIDEFLTDPVYTSALARIEAPARTAETTSEPIRAGFYL